MLMARTKNSSRELDLPQVQEESDITQHISARMPIACSFSSVTVLFPEVKIENELESLEHELSSLDQITKEEGRSFKAKKVTLALLMRASGC